MSAVMRAVCDGCEAEVDVAPDALFAFDCACPLCGGMLVLEEAGAAADDPKGDYLTASQIMEAADLGDLDVDAVAYGADPAPETDAHRRPRFEEDRPTLQDKHPGHPRDARSSEDRPTKDDDSGARQPLPPSFEDRPTKADTDPYEAAAAALDSSIGGAREAAFASFAPDDALDRAVSSRRTTQSVATWSEADLADEAPVGSVVLMPGRPATSPPLPAWDEDDLPPDDLVEVVEVAGTTGRGSRTFERETAPAAPPPEAPPEAREEPEDDPGLTSQAPSAPLGPTGGISTSGRFARIPAAPAPRAQPPLFGGDDLDWLALIDDNLPELETPDENGAPRVLVRMAEADAGGDDAARAEQLRSTMRALETGGPAAIEALLGKPSLAAGGPSDTRQVKRFASGDKGDTTRPIGASASKEDTKGWGEERPAPQDTVRETLVGAGGGDKDLDTQAHLRRAAEEPDTQAHLRRDAETKAHRMEGREQKAVEAFQARDLDPALVCARDAGSAEADHFRQLFHRVFERGERSPRVVLVTSPDPGAGKTTVAANLAIVAARLPGRGAVLVDADPRGRGVLPAFGVRRSEGLLEALGSETDRDPRDCVVQFQLGQLDVIPLGIPSSDAAELLVSSRMTRFVQRLRDSYPDAVIIIDGSSVLGTADPLALGRIADGVVLVARAGHTGKEDLRRAVEVVGRERLLGVVLNDAAA